MIYYIVFSLKLLCKTHSEMYRLHVLHIHANGCLTRGEIAVHLPTIANDSIALQRQNGRHLAGCCVRNRSAHRIDNLRIGDIMLCIAICNDDFPSIRIRIYSIQ